MKILTKEEKQIVAWLRGFNARHADFLADGIEQHKHRQERMGNGITLGESSAK